MKHQSIIFSNEISKELQGILDSLEYNKIIVLTDVNTKQFVLPQLMSIPSIANAVHITMKSGDMNKNLDTLSSVWKQMCDAGASRHSILINIGGGVVTDLGGFAASTFKRGIRFINIPTTLLGAVDAAIGGKTGINFNGLKNEIGNFNEAMAVIVSTIFFATLPVEEIKSGYAEMIKHGLLSDKETLDNLLQYNFSSPDPDKLLLLLQQSIEVKRKIVKEDPHEHGIRRALNLGHTAGHAFESLAMKRMEPIPHGYAVAWGLVVELILSHMALKFNTDLLHKISHYIYSNYGAMQISCDDYPALLDYMRHDKKSDHGEINFSLMKKPGEVEIDQILDADNVETALDIYRDIMHI